jgi:hypothetical protein
MQRRGRYQALAKERTMLLRCESLEPPMSQLGQILTPRSAPACLLPPNADIAMFAGRAVGGAGHRVGQVVERGYTLTLPHVLR